MTKMQATKIVSKTSLVCQSKMDALRDALVSHGPKWATPYGKFCEKKGWKFNKKLVTTVDSLLNS